MKQKGSYINRHNLGIIVRFWIGSGYKSIISLLFVLIAVGTFGILGGLTIFVIGNLTIILKGIQNGRWKRSGELPGHNINGPANTVNKIL